MGSRKRQRSQTRLPETAEYVALDCEFVGVGTNNQSALGRCSIVDYDGRIVCDIFAKPEKKVTNYRTKWSGIRPRDLVNAVSFENARNIVRAAIKDRIVVGHAINNDFKVLEISVDSDLVRDTSTYIPLRGMSGLPRNQLPGLKKLAKALLKRNIQSGEHSSVEDAKATMDVFKLVRHDWEQKLAREDTKRARTNNNSDSDDDDDDDYDPRNNDDDDDDDDEYVYENNR